MKRRKSLSSKHRPGSALVVVLAFIVLISIVLLSYLASTQSSLKKSSSSVAITQTDLLASAATAAVIDDLRQEMLASADGSAQPATNQPMIVSQPWAMVPGRVLSSAISPTDSNFANLIKQSLRGTAFYPGDNPAVYTAKDGGSSAGAAGRTRASAVSTADPSRHGRVISAARWNKPLLLGGGGFTSTNQLPDWILISRKGPLTNGTSPGNYNQKISSNDEYVIGRFAYNIYDEGGLLDINVAGFPSSATNNSLQKGSTAWADLTAIPGVTNAAKIIAWRNTNTATSAANYLSLIQGQPLGATNATNSPWGEPGGFQRPYATNGVSDNRFFTRQDLLKYVQSSGDGGMTTNALPFLTSFSADLDQPSIAPDTSRPMVQKSDINGGNSAFGKDLLVNPNFLSMVNANGPVVKRRFPLDRLRYVNANPSPEDMAKALTYFGLVWNGAGWTYSDTSIKKLSEVAALGREPNFIELLQATVGAGSLGGQYQINLLEPNNSPRNLVEPNGNAGRDGSVSWHIMQLAANIIDQYDADSYPTAITFAGRTFYGVEDLPYLFGIRISAYTAEQVASADLTVTPPAGGAMPIRCPVMLQPTLWNPHAASAATFNGPTNFRVVASGNVYPEARVGWWTGAGNNYYVTASGIPGTLLYPSTNPKDIATPIADFDTIDAANATKSIIMFQTTTSGAASFREAYTITSANYPTGSGAGGGTLVAISDSIFNQASGENSTQALGFFAGYVWAGPVVGATRYFDNGQTISSDGLTFSLEYQDTAGNWKTYDVMDSVPIYQNIFQNNQNGRRPRSWARIDPRADRFGYRYFLYTVASQWAQGATYRPASAAGLTGQGDPLGLDGTKVNWTTDNGNDAWGLISDNKASAGIPYYADADGVRRLAMGGYANGTTGLPMVTGNSASRPVMLNRPFRSVAELGYAARAMPWKQIDFYNPESGDAALLDVFCINEPADASSTPLVSGRVNLNTRRSEVLQAMLRGVALQDGSTTTLSTTEAKTIGDNLTGWTTNQAAGAGPLRNRSELVGKFVTGTTYSGFATNAASVLASTNQAITFKRESFLRALADGGTTRTWTFLIDLIVQKGRYGSNSTNLSTSFTVEGEEHIWIHVAMDRYSGQVVAKQVEAVNE